MEVRIAILIGAVERIVFAPLLISGIQSRPVREKGAPVHSKALAVTVRVQSRNSRHAVVSGRVEGFGVVDRTRKMAAAEDCTGKSNAAGVGHRPKIRIAARLVVVGVYVKGDEIGIVVKTAEGCCSSEAQAVAGIDFVTVAAGIVGGDCAIQSQAEIVADGDLRRQRQRDQQNSP